MKYLANCILALAGVAGTSYAVAAETVAGHIQFITGEATIIAANGSSRPASKGAPVDAGDRIRTGPATIMQIKMTDGGLLSVRANSDMKIDQYHFNGKADGSEKEQLSLATGTFRSITGLIGKVNKQNYKITTPVATIGIRGTDHEPFHIPPNADNSNQDEAGTYDRVNSGQTILTSNGGSVLLNPNQVGYVPDSNTPPARLPQMPGFFSQPISFGSGSSAGAGGGDSGDSGDSTLLSQIDPSSTILPTDTTQQAGLTQVVTSTLISGSTAPVGWGGAGSYSQLVNSLPDSGSGSISYERSPLVTIGSNNQLLYLKTTDNSGLFEFTANNAPLLQTGSIQVKDPTTLTPLYTVYWGRWGSGFSVVDNGVLQQSVGDFHYIWTSQVTTSSQLQTLIANQMTGYYTNIGHTLPTDQNGTTGTLNSMSLNVDFGAQTVQANISVSMPNNANWVATGNGSLTQFLDTNTSGSGGVPLSTGSGGNVTIQQTSSSVHGQFVGPNAEGAIASYNMTGNLATGAPASITGVVALDKTCGGGGC